MINLTKEQKLALHSKQGARQEFYKAELLDRYGIYKSDLYFTDATISVNSDYEVKKSATIDLYSLDDVDTMSDKIGLHMGVMVNGSVNWFALGEFMIVDVDGLTINLADETIKLQQARVLEKKVFKAGSLYTDALKWFLITSNIIKFDIQQSDLVLPADIVVDDSKSKLTWFNYIADQVNYTHLHVDNNGYFVSSKYKEPTYDRVDYEYRRNEYSVITGVKSKIDYWNVPNVFKRVVSRGDLPPLVSIVKNDDPSNRFSTVNRGYEIVDVRTVDLVSTQAELDLLTSREAMKAKQVEEVVNVTTINMPVHGIYDVVELDGTLYEQVNWQMTLNSRSQMTHYFRRVVLDGLTSI